MNRKRYCCMTGNRTIPSDKMEQVRKALQKEVDQAIEDGYTWFCCGFDGGGADQLFAEIVNEKRRERPEEIMLDAVLTSGIRPKSRKSAVEELIYKCTAIHFVYKAADDCARTGYLKRDFEMVRVSDRVIAVYDGTYYGRTATVMHQAQLMRRELRVIDL